MGGPKGKGDEKRGRGGWKGDGKWWPDEDKGRGKGQKDGWKGEGKRKGEKEWRSRKDEWVPKDREKPEGKENKGKGKGQEARSQLSSNAPDFTPGLYDYSLTHPHLWVEMPPLWQEFADADGAKYYYNAKTGLSQWEIPAELDKGKEEKKRVEKLDKEENGKDWHKEWQKDWQKDWPKESKDGKDGGKGKKRRKAEVKEKEPNFGPPGCNLFVFHLPDDWTDDDLLEYFAPHGSVVSAKVMKELGTGRSRGFGFVSYEDRVSAATAIKKMQGYKILGKRLKVEFKKGEGEGKGDEKLEEEKVSGDDERLIGYLRAISAKTVVQSLKESEKEQLDQVDSEEG